MIASSVKDKIEKNLDLFMEKAAGMGLYLPRPTVVYDLKGRCAGMALIDKGIIRLNIDLLKEYESEMVWNVLGHEFAHHMQATNIERYMMTRTRRYSYHGRWFKLFCNELGVDDSTTHSMKTETVSSKKRYTVKCGCPKGCQVTSIIINKMKKGNKYTCKKCRRLLSPVNPLVFNREAY